ncbi:hypothetical protein ACB098_06G167400 [Castanea mollissima]
MILDFSAYHNSNSVSLAETLISHFIPNHQSWNMITKSINRRTRRHDDKFGQISMLKNFKNIKITEKFFFIWTRKMVGKAKPGNWVMEFIWMEKWVFEETV